MRWRSSGSGSSAESGSAAALEEAASTSEPTSSSPLVGNDSEAGGAADSSLSPEPSALTSGNSNNNSNSNSNSNSGSTSSSQRQAIDPAADSSSTSASAVDPDGDPPYSYRRSQQTLATSATSAESPGTAKDGANVESNDDEDDMDGLPALEAVNPDDGDDDDTGDDHEVPWKPQATQSTCEFTHTITNYSQKRDSGCKKAEYSATTVDEFGNRWRLIVYVNGNGRASNHHLSLFLQVADADDLPFGWKKAVSYVLTLEHPSGPNLSYAKRNPDKTFKLCPKAIDWGWSQFITSDRIQQEGFVQDDSLVVRASVTVKSSSVSIDLEDAELYLKCAVEEGKPEAVQLCLDQGASVNCQFKDDLYTPLHTACSTSTGDDDDEDDDDDADDHNDDNEEDDDSDHGRGEGGNKKNRNNTRPTASSGSMRVLQLLLEKGADGNACNKWRETPLLIAANNGHRAAVEALLKHGADPSLCSEAGWSALTFAAHKGYDDIVELLLKDGAPVNCRVTEDASTPLHKACAGSKPGHLAAVKLLLANTADVHALNKWRETPLLTAANHGQAGAVDALLKAGADPCKCTDTGWSPLSIAAYKGHDDVVKLLLEEGAPTEEADPTLSALLQAATKGLPDTVELLLKHGADHTVTTKKGDTALSILVEQNLIDAAVDMVTEYNASIPRCSRDRKKVQRARLLINLRMKQREREGGKSVDLADDDGDEDEIEQEESLAESNATVSLSQLGDENTAEQIEGTGTTGGSKKKKKKKKKSSAEEEAKAAEAALLMELEAEDAERQKQEQEANKKSAKKKKKKERERQQKKEQEEKRLAEERERDEQRRKEREEKEAKERVERERVLAIKRKEEEVERKRILERQKLEQQQREEERKKEMQKRKQQQDSASSSSSVSSTDKKGKQAAPKPNKSQTGSTINAAKGPGAAIRPVQTAKQAPAKSSGPSTGQSTATSLSKPPGKNRGWETKRAAAGTSDPPESKHTPPQPIGGGISTSSNVSGTGPASNFLTTSQHETKPSELFHAAPPSSPFSSFGGDMMNPPGPAPVSYTKSEPILNGFPPSSFSVQGIEVPAVALFRRNKVSELLQRCSMARSTSDALGAIDEATIKKVLYRWIVRAAHEGTSYLDCVIASWSDFEKQAAFFQRQFISESRKGMNSSSFSSSMVSIEVLKEAGSTISLLCHNLAKEVAQFRGRVEEQLPSDWNDAIIGMKASDVANNGSGHSPSIVLDWANRAHVFLPAVTFSKLQERCRAHPGRLLSTIFSAQIRYETVQLISADTMMDFRLPADTLSVLSLKANVTAEIWSDPMSSLSGNVFWGQFSDVDEQFGGLAPFSKDDGREDILVRHGGSVATAIPLDNMVAAQYLHRMVDLLDLAENGRVPLSFAVFLRSECFMDGTASPSFNDLCGLEPRFRDRRDLVSRVEMLAPRQHGFSSKKSETFEPSATGSLLVVLQNASGAGQYQFSDLVVSEILRSLSSSPGVLSKPVSDESSLPVMSEMSFSAPEFVPAASRSKDIFAGGDRGNNFFLHAPAGHAQQAQGQAPISPMPHQNNILPDFGAPIGSVSDFGGFGGSAIGNAFSVQSGPGSRSSRPARGRLFDLVDDDGGDDEHGTADVVSGMLGNLNMDDLFSHQPSKSANGEIDIEAISLMGIGGPNSASSTSSTGGLQPRRSHFGY